MLGGTAICIGVLREADAVPEFEALAYAVTELLLISSELPFSSSRLALLVLLPKGPRLSARSVWMQAAAGTM